MKTSPARRLLGLVSLSLTAALFAMLAVGSASAATVTQKSVSACDSYSGRTDWNRSLQLPQFNPSLGSLQSVEVTQTAGVKTDVGAENTSDGNARTDTFTLRNASARVEAPGVAPLSSSLTGQTKEHTFAKYDGSRDFAGASGWSASFGDDSNQNVGVASSNAGYTGTGFVSVPAVASADTASTLSGNGVVEWTTIAKASVCVVYTYTEEILVCVGDYVWIDANKNGLQDAGEQPVAGRTVTVTVDGTTYTTTTDANGRWTICNLEPNRVCVISVDLPDGYVVTASNQGNDTLDSDGTPSGSDASITNCATPPRGSDLTFDVGVNLVPPVVNNPTPVALSTPTPADAPEPAVLRVGKRSTAGIIRSGGTATFLVTVRNRGTVAVANVTVCDTPPRLLAFSSRPRGSFFRAGKLCWTVATLDAGQSLTFRYTMRASSVARRSCVTNSVTAAAAVGGSATARASLCIRPTAIRSLPLAG